MFTVYPGIEPVCFSRMDLCLSSILAVLLSWGVPCNHLAGLPHVRSKALSEFTDYLQNCVMSYLFIATTGLRQSELCTSNHVLLRSASAVTELQPLARPYARQPPLLSHLVSRLGIRRVLYCIPECTGSYF